MNTNLKVRRVACTTGSHNWFTQINDLGDHYEVCSGCGKQARWVPMWTTA